MQVDRVSAAPHRAERDELSAGMAAVRRGGQKHWLTPIALAEGGLLTDVAIILDLVAAYLPLLGPFVAPAVPAPFAVLMLRRGARVTLLTAAVSTFLMTILTGPHYGWRMGLQAIVGLIMGWAMQRHVSWVVTILLGALLVTTVGFGATLGLIFVVGMPLSDVLDLLRNGLQSADGIAAFVAGLLGAREVWAEIHLALVPAVRQALRFWPALLYAYILAFALPTVMLYYAVANVTARVLGHDVSPFPPVWVSRLVWYLLAPARFLGRRKRHATDAALEGDEP